jgi:DNA-directed RNA polymerase subunit RPC12/RpoP
VVAGVGVAAAAVVAVAVAAVAVGSAKPEEFRVGSGRIVGTGLMIGSLVILLAFLGWVVTAFSTSETSSGGMVLGILLVLLVMSPIFGIGVYVFRKGSVEKSQFALVQQQKKLLNMVLTQGQVTINQLVSEFQLPREQIEEMIRDVVGKQLFSGAINWQKGILYSVESQQLTDGRKCPNCGGELTFAGKGVITCPYCGSDVFLTQRAAATTVAN